MAITIDRDELIRLRREGAKIERPDGSAITGRETRTEVQLLAEIADKLDTLIEKQDRPDPDPVIVPAPKVTLNVPETKRSRVSKFKLVKNAQGRTTEVIPVYEE